MSTPNDWQFFKFGLFVTGKGERDFLPSLFRAIMATGKCTFTVLARIGQRSTVTSKKRLLSMVGKGQTLPTRDEEEISIPVRRFLGQGYSHILLVDDLERDREPQVQGVFQRYRDALDLLLAEDQRTRVSVHFFVYMLEAYYFADSKAINAVLGTMLADHEGDVEQIAHPKNQLKSIARNFDERIHGREIIAVLDAEHVLNNPTTCSALRTLFAWCWQSIGEKPGPRFQLEQGAYFPVTSCQIN